MSLRKKKTPIKPRVDKFLAGQKRIEERLFPDGFSMSCRDPITG